ncbi:putative Transmembrane emp24 domain-containing protein [Fasciola hepatica]|uniref:Transmembrane emp24 domain-containing protein n=1 Tax=Fasciola hepatica TaxID=6192 RepID=A0A4E0RCR5_FASHE|nr:putative Transmembrane emp24 domain-containing protein [Fasciola hepatica]
MLSLFVIAFLLSWPTQVAPMYFYLTNQKPMCFIEEVPDVTMVKGTYRITGEKGKDYTAESIHVEIMDPSNNQILSRIREEYFRQLSESTSHRVTYWSLGQLILLCGIGLWQMRHLRAFFQAKKLV